MVPTPADVRAMAEKYAEAWSSHSPEAVASFYEPDGRITVNHGEPTIGREAIAEVAQGFFDEFPDLVVHMDDIRTSANSAIFCWTLEGTDGRPEGKGHAVRISGWEAWTLSDDVRVIESYGYFDAEEYERQLEHGIGG